MDGLGELQKRLQAMDHAQRVGSTQVNFGGTHFQPVGFVLAQLLDLFPFARAGDDEVGLGHRAGAKENSCPTGEIAEKTICRTLYPGVHVAVKFDGERLVNGKVALARPYVGRKRHERKHLAPLRCRPGGESKHSCQ